ncbi:MAG: hypothetical protein FWG98_14675 [Candidatus Cloacimonetes bacterium]|nr:hypothetical protein [Candidatus Cloacimonadota bacterium]
MGLKRNNIFFIAWILLIIFTVIISMCCTKSGPFTPPPPDNKDDYWNHFLFKDNTFVNFITNATVVDDLLICTVDWGILMFDDLESGDAIRYKELPRVSVGYDNVPILSHEMIGYVAKNRNDLILFSNYQWYGGGADGIKWNQLGEEFIGWSFILDLPFQNTFGAINSQNRFVGMITNRDLVYWAEDVRNYAIYADTDINYMGTTIVTNVGYWDIPSMLGNRLSVLDIFAFKDKFYISYYRTNAPSIASYYAEISVDGTIREFRDPFVDRNMVIYKFFEYQGVLFAHTNNQIIKYTMDGENWTPLFVLTPAVNTFKEIDQYIFIHRADNIIVLEDLIDGVKGYRLPKENMAGVAIRSINKFRDDLVIATTHGMFYKSFEEVMNDKELVFTLERGILNLEGDF